MLEPRFLSALDLLALAKAPHKELLEDIRDQVAAGTYDIDLEIHLKGRLSVAPPSFANNANSLDLWSLVAVLADRLRGESLEKIVEEECQRQLRGEKRDASSVKEKTQELMKKLLGTTRQERNGQVQFEGSAAATGKTRKKREREPVNLFATKPVAKQA